MATLAAAETARAAAGGGYSGLLGTSQRVAVQRERSDRDSGN